MHLGKRPPSPLTLPLLHAQDPCRLFRQLSHLSVPANTYDSCASTIGWETGRALLLMILNASALAKGDGSFYRMQFCEGLRTHRSGIAGESGIIFCVGAFAVLDSLLAIISDFLPKTAHRKDGHWTCYQICWWKYTFPGKNDKFQWCAANFQSVRNGTQTLLRSTVLRQLVVWWALCSHGFSSRNVICWVLASEMVRVSCKVASWCPAKSKNNVGCCLTQNQNFLLGFTEIYMRTQ